MPYASPIANTAKPGEGGNGAKTTKAVQKNVSKSLEIKYFSNVRIFGLIWAKVRGYKVWPGIIEKIIDSHVLIHFFGDYSYSYLHRNAVLYSYEGGFTIYEKGKRNDAKLEKAVKEATLYALMIKRTCSVPSNCCICNRSH